MKVFVLLLITAIYTSVNAQIKDENKNAFWPFEILRKEIQKPYNIIKELKSKKTNALLDKDIYTQALMTGLCFCNEIEEKNKIAINRDSIINLKESEKLNKFAHPIEASKIIINEAKKNSIIIINEAHLYPQNRVFITSILKQLFKIGYKELYLEDFSDEVDLNTYSFPTKEMGFYINEPHMANLVRSAMRIGFQLHAYDSVDPDLRDSIAAQNILKTYSKMPNHKILIVCGFSHNMEHRYPNVLASVLKRISGIDPLTIDQTIYSERETSPFYSQLISFYQITKPSILVNSNGEIVKMKNTPCDIQVISPRTKYIHGIPNWSINKQKKRINPPIKSGIIEAYYKNEINNPSAIPIDMLKTEEFKHRKYLYIPRKEKIEYKYYTLDYIPIIH